MEVGPPKKCDASVNTASQVINGLSNDLICFLAQIW